MNTVAPPPDQGLHMPHGGWQLSCHPHGAPPWSGNSYEQRTPRGQALHTTNNSRSLSGFQSNNDTFTKVLRGSRPTWA
eukprot:scaffold10408_cov26-Tisochrysis_lutea.AAC.3